MEPIELSGVTMAPGNRCHRGTCENDACTAVWVGRVQTNLCGWHLKILVEEMERD